MATTSVDPTIAPLTTNSGWTYMIIGGRLWGAYHTSLTSLAVTTSSSGAYCSDLQQVNYPSGVTLDDGNAGVVGIAGSGSWVANATTYSSNVKFRVFRSASTTANISLDLVLMGKVSSLS